MQAVRGQLCKLRGGARAAKAVRGVHETCKMRMTIVEIVINKYVWAVLHTGLQLMMHKIMTSCQSTSAQLRSTTSLTRRLYSRLLFLHMLLLLVIHTASNLTCFQNRAVPPLNLLASWGWGRTTATAFAVVTRHWTSIQNDTPGWRSRLPTRHKLVTIGFAVCPSKCRRLHRLCNIGVFAAGRQHRVRTVGVKHG